jgi:hypothetical protein
MPQLDELSGDKIYEFIEITDEVSIEKDELVAPRPYLIEVEDAMIFHTSEISLFGGKEFVHRCNALREQRWLCTNRAESEIYKRMVNNDEDENETLKYAAGKCALELYNFFVPSIAPKDVLSVLGMTVQYKRGDEEFPLRKKMVDNEDFPVEIYDKFPFDSVVDYIFGLADSLVRQYTREHEGDVLMTRILDTWRVYNPGQGKIYIASEYQC